MSKWFEDEFSVLMAVYGGDDSDLFNIAVKSVLENSLVPSQIVLVIDGPISNSMEAVVAKFSQNDIVCIIRLPENVGLARALNFGLEMINTTWVLRADSDDYNVPDRFQIMSDRLRASDGQLDLFGSAIREVDKSGNELAVRNTPLDHEAICKFARKRNPFNHMTVAMRLECVRAAGGYPNVYLKEDYALWATMLCKGARTSNISDTLVDATTGNDMFKRRGGLRYALAEIKLQRHLVACGLKGKAAALVDGVLRSVVFLGPSHLRSLIYVKLLRRKAH